MNKQQMLEAMEHAKQVHIAQMAKIESVMAGKEVTNPTALGKMDCDCGLWFYSNEKIMKEILGALLFDKLDAHHEKWHRDYANIYNIYFKEEKKGFFSKLIGAGKIDEMTKDKAKLYFSELQQDTEELLQATEVAKRRVNALSDSKFR